MNETWQEKDARLRHTPGSLLAYAMDTPVDDAIGFLNAIRTLENSDDVTDVINLLRQVPILEEEIKQLTKACEEER